MIVVICGVSGSGKSTIGKLLSETLGVPFYDADDYHPALNIEKMANGIPLDDEDRRPWLETLANKVSEWQGESGAVLACSALKESYREVLGSQCEEKITWIFLHASEELLVGRLASRKEHFFDRNLLSTQLDALETPDNAWQVDVESSPDDIVRTILERLRSE